VLAVVDPGKRDGRAQPIVSDLVAAPEWIALALADQGRRAQAGQVLGAEALRPSGRMEREAETDQAIDARIIGDQAGDAPAHGLAADHEPMGCPDAARSGRAGFPQHRLAIRRAPASLGSMRAMYGKRKRTTRTPASASPDAIRCMNGDSGPCPAPWASNSRQ
jgi:hypothetical protein